MTKAFSFGLQLNQNIYDHMCFEDKKSIKHIRTLYVEQATVFCTDVALTPQNIKHTTGIQ